MFSSKLPYFSNFSIRPKLKHLLWLFIATLLLFAIAISGASAQENQVLTAIRDNTLIESPTGELSNGLGPSFFVGRTNQSANSIRRGLIFFDIAEAIPAGSTITEVELTLNLERSAGEEESIELHRVLADWGEGDSSFAGGRGATAAIGDATWIHGFYDTDLWSQPGGDFSAEVSAVAIVGDIGSYTWGSTPEIVQDVQEWLDSPENNFGWLLLGNETASRTAKVFASRQSSDALMQPQLSVMFEPAN